jgi:hypothetical protein
MDEIHEKAVKYIDMVLKPIVESIGETLEGNVFEEDPNYKDLFLPKRKNIIVSCQNKTNALEIGFNSGYSAVLILLSNPKIKLTCVDIGWHKYTIPCYQQIKQDFGDRIQLLIGDSRNVVPNINDKFDLIHIDGGHSLDIAESDIVNTNRLLMDNAVIIMDDVNINDNDHTLANLWIKYVNIYGYKEPSFEIYKNNHNDVREIK